MLEEGVKIEKIKSKFRKFSNRPTLIYESKIREWDGSTISKTRVAASDTINLKKAFMNNAELLGLNISMPSFNNDKEIKAEVNEIRELMKKKREDDMKKVKAYIEK